MRLEPLYRVRFEYPEEHGVGIEGPDGRQERYFFIAEGRCEGRVTGRFRGANHPDRRVDGTFVPDFQGVIVTDGGAELIFDMHGYGRAYPRGRRQILVSVTHVTDDEDLRWLNDVVCVGAGEVRSRDDRGAELVIDVAELIWEAIDG